MGRPQSGHPGQRLRFGSRRAVDSLAGRKAPWHDFRIGASAQPRLGRRRQPHALSRGANRALSHSDECSGDNDAGPPLSGHEVTPLTQEKNSTKEKGYTPMATTQKRLAQPEAPRTEQGPARMPAVRFGRELCGTLESAEQREWLVTNGIGGFASGTVSGNVTRRYHGLLVAALKPPVGRTQLVAKLEETAGYAEKAYELGTNRWASGAVEPKGYLNLESFHLDGTTPVWRYAIADALLEKRIWMRQGENTTYVQYTLLRAGRPLALELKALVNYRDFHSSTHAGDWRMGIDPVCNGVRVTAFDGAAPFYLLAAGATCEIRHEWYRDCSLPLERYRGLDDHEDHLLAGIFRTELQPGQAITVVLSTNPEA